VSQKCTILICYFYVCGEFTMKAQRCSFMPLVKKSYKLYFGWKFGYQDKLCAPHICCSTCAGKINRWQHGSQPSIHFAVAIVWCERKDHFWDCYICLTNVTDFFAQSTHGIQYQNLHSAIWPVPHDSFRIPKPPIVWNFDKEGEEASQRADMEIQPVRVSKIQISLH
jgi:hypothetical protein